MNYLSCGFYLAFINLAHLSKNQIVTHWVRLVHQVARDYGPWQDYLS
jgi:hypothetical protein